MVRPIYNVPYRVDRTNFVLDPKQMDYKVNALINYTPHFSESIRNAFHKEGITIGMIYPVKGTYVFSFIYGWFKRT